MSKVHCSLPMPKAKPSGWNFLGSFPEVQGRLIVIEEKESAKLEQDDKFVKFLIEGNDMTLAMPKSHLILLSNKAGVELAIIVNDVAYYRGDLVVKTTKNSLKFLSRADTGEVKENAKPETAETETAETENN